MLIKPGVNGVPGKFFITMSAPVIISPIMIKAFVYPESVTGLEGNIVTHNATSHVTNLIINTSHQFQGNITFSDSTVVSVVSGTVVMNAWYHVAITFQGSPIRNA